MGRNHNSESKETTLTLSQIHKRGQNSRSGELKRKWVFYLTVSKIQRSTKSKKEKGETKQETTTGAKRTLGDTWSANRQSDKDTDKIICAQRADGPVRHGLEEGTGGKYLRQGKQLRRNHNTGGNYQRCSRKTEKAHNEKPR